MIADIQDRKSQDNYRDWSAHKLCPQDKSYFQSGQRTSYTDGRQKSVCNKLGAAEAVAWRGQNRGHIPKYIRP